MMKVEVTTIDKDGAGRLVENRSTVQAFYFDKGADAVRFDKSIKQERGYIDSVIIRMK